jgi:S-adenosylmethionine:tRNA ribosyltransferase-isomerase
VEKVEDHSLHKESYSISPETADAVNRARDQKRRIVAVGTTTVRTLEYSLAQSRDGRLAPGRGEADLFIYPGYQFCAVGAMLTNFHLPESTLLMLVCAFAGRELVLNAYRRAVQQGYRFYSYGDCMFVE